MRACPECNRRTEEMLCPDDGRPTVLESRLRAQPGSDPHIGVTIHDKYLVEERLGRGGMGAVYRARHVETGGYVAVKVMNPDMMEDESAVRRFYIEAQNTHRLHHPNTVRVSDFGQTSDGALFLVMEYVDGVSLSQLAKRAGRLDADRVIHIATQVLKSLGEAHAIGVVHRDVKPDNIMLIEQFGETDFVKVLDFGISRALESTGASTQGAIGTPRYMAPEQWRGAKIDPRADLYAVGCLMYELLAGRPPFVIESRGTEQILGLMNAHLNEPPPPLPEVAPDVGPPALVDLVMSLLHKQREARPDNASTVLELLGAIRTGELLDWSERPTEMMAGAVSPSDATVALPDAGDSTGLDDGADSTATPRRRGALAVAFAVVLLAGAGAGWYALDVQAPAPGPAPAAASPPADEPVDLRKLPSGEALPAPAPAVAAAAPPEEAPVIVAQAPEIRLASEPPGATVALRGGVPLGVTPLVLPADVAAGTSNLVLVLEGHREHELAMPLPPGDEDRTVHAQLVPLPVLSLTSAPAGATVVLKQTAQGLGTTPLEWTVPEDVADGPLAGGGPTLVFEARDGRTVERTVPHARLTTGRVDVAVRFHPVQAKRPKKAKRRVEPKPKAASGPQWTP